MNREFVLPGCAAAALLILFALAGGGWSDAHPALSLPSFHLPTGVVVLASALVGGACALTLSAHAADARGRRSIGYAALLPVVAIAGTLLLVASVPALSPPRAAAGMLLGTLAMVSGVRCVELIAAGEPIGFESHWGGLGGGSGGWRLLPAAALAILTLGFSGGTVAVLVAETSKPPPPQASAPEHVPPPPDPKHSGLISDPMPIRAASLADVRRTGGGSTRSRAGRGTEAQPATT